jgi:molybdate transport system substrate-binding protein
MSRRRRGRAWLAGLAWAAIAAGATAQPRGPLIAVASSLNVALPAIADQFVRDGGAPVELVFGASGTLTRQILDGAPFELFLAADEDFPDRLTAQGVTRDSGVVYAVGRLVIFAPTGSPLTVDERLDGLARLVERRAVTRLAIANPDVAPYGRAAEAVLRKRGLWEPLRQHLVLGDTVAQAAQFATTGNAVGGLIAYSMALSPEFAARGSYAMIPEADYPPLRQRMVLLNRATPNAQRFYAYLQGASAAALLKKFGFGVPG